MIATEDLIARLADDCRAPPSRRGAAWRFAAMLALAMGAAMLAMALALDGAYVSHATAGPGPILVKWGFPLTLALLASVALWVLGQPGASARGVLLALGVPFLLVLGFFAVDIARNPQPFPGATWRTCLLAMGLVSPPAFAAAIAATRALAPTEPRIAGAVAGLFGGAVAMTAYAPFCPERGMVYMVVFYGLPILAMAALGWLSGPRLLRW